MSSPRTINVHLTVKDKNGKNQKFSVSPGQGQDHLNIQIESSSSSQDDIVTENTDTLIQIKADDTSDTHAELQPSASTLRNRRNKARKKAAKAGRRAEHIEHTETSSLIIEPSSPVLSIQDEDDQSEQEAEQTWGEWFGSAYTSVKESAQYTLEHPVESLKSAGVWSLAAVTAAPAALNALVMPSGKSPEQISKAWWDEMSVSKQAHSVSNAGSSFLINVIMNAYFLPTAWDKFSSSLKHMFDSPKEFIDNNASIFLGLGGAVAAAAIAYNAFLWMPVGHISAGAPAAISFIVTLASRYIGVKNVFKRIHNFFSDDATAQAEFADALDHVKNTHTTELNIIFEDIMDKVFADRDENDLDKPLTEQDYDKLSKALAEKLEAFANLHPDLIDDKATAEYIAQYAALIFDLSFAFFMCGIPAGLTFMQKGFDGVNTLAKFAGTDLTGINPWLRRLIGAAPGLASGMLYMDSGTKIRNTLYELAQYLYENPKQLPFALITLAANGLGASGPQNVAAGVLANPNNITGVNQHTDLGSAFVILNALGGGVVNSNASINKAFLSSGKNAVNIDKEDLAKYLSKVNEHMVSHETAGQFRQFLAAVNKPVVDSRTTQDPYTFQAM